jgi:hypothetical protein
MKSSEMRYDVRRGTVSGAPDPLISGDSPVDVALAVAGIGTRQCPIATGTMIWDATAANILGGFPGTDNGGLSDQAYRSRRDNQFSS